MQQQLRASTLRERLRQEISRRGLSAVDLAREAGVKTSFLYDILNGKSANPSTIKLGQVARTLGVSLAYLAGLDQVPAPPHAEEEYTHIPRIDVNPSAGGGTVVANERATGEYYCFRRAWIRDRLQATPERLRVVYVRGDSMAPALQDGDIILVDTGQTMPSPPGIFVLDDGLGIVAKRLELIASEPPRLRILSDNPQYSPYERELRETRIIGRVVWFAREL